MQPSTARLTRCRGLLAGLLAVFLPITFLVRALPAQVPPLINYQGRVAVGNVNFDGNGSFKFALVNSDGTTTYWSNDGTSSGGSEPTAAVSLPVAKGLYSVELGDASLPNMTAVPQSVFNNPDVRLRVWFNDGTNGSQLLSPDQRIASVGYAMTSAATLAAYGDGSAGPLTINVGTQVDARTTNGFNALPQGANLQFTDLTIHGTLVVPSGTVIRATGNVTVTGTIGVGAGTADNGVFRPHPGVSTASAANPAGGIGLLRLQAAQLIRLPVYGGGAGARNASSFGGEGGGSLSIRAGGHINVSAGGVITADGQNGGSAATQITGAGGGGGGVIALMAKRTLTSAGALRVNGGNGANGSDPNAGSTGEGGGGGGGGGVILLVASTTPTITGTNQVNGGTAGANAGTSPTVMNPGGGGGGSGGNGGTGGGGSSLQGGIIVPAGGAAGYVLTTVTASPENLVF